MNYLIGDIGNTSTKISILNHKFIIKKSYILNTQKIVQKKNINVFFKKILKKNLNSKVLFSSVVPKAYKIVKHFLNKQNFNSYEMKDLKIKKIFQTNIKNLIN